MSQSRNENVIYIKITKMHLPKYFLNCDIDYKQSTLLRWFLHKLFGNIYRLCINKDGNW